jgi:hypothetical protein
LFIPLVDNEHTLKGAHSTWNVAYNMHGLQINLLKKTFVYIFIIIMHTTNWKNIESQAFELATKNDTNIQMNKILDANIGFSSQNVTNCIKVQPYNIAINILFINSCIGVSTIIDSINIDVKDQIMPTLHSIQYFKN